VLGPEVANDVIENAISHIVNGDQFHSFRNLMNRIPLLTKFLMEKLIVSQFVKKLLDFYGNQEFSTVSAKADHCFLS
jgi:hypothetical protein